MFSITHQNSFKTTKRNLGDFIFDLKTFELPDTKKYTYIFSCLRLRISNKSVALNQNQQTISFKITRVNSLKELLCLK